MLKILFKLIVISIGLYYVFTLNALNAQAPVLTEDEVYNSELTQWVNRLVQDESGNTNVIILDTNGLYSYGCLQFQYSTFEEQKKIYNFDGEIGSCKDQKELAKAMIRGNWNNWRKWYNSVLYKTAGYPPKKIVN